MAKSRGNRIIIKLANKATGTSFTTTRNRINTKDKIEMTKYDPVTRKHEKFVEVKVK